MEPSTKLRSAGRPEAEGNRRTDQRANGSQHLGGIRRSDQNAAIAGDVAMIESEVQPVLKTLRSRDINVVAIHNHMIGVSPHVVFLHYWKGSTDKPASAFRAVLDQLGHAPAGRT